MPYSRSRSHSRSRKRVPATASANRRVKIAPYVVPTRRSMPNYSAMLVPTRWVKTVVAIFLLPLCAILTQTFFTVFTRATVTQRLWAAEEFWFFSLGVLLWVIAFFGLPRPLLVYVLGHELTHALWVWLMGGRVSQFRVTRDGGHIMTDRNNFWIALTPYFFPLYSILALALYGALSLFTPMVAYGRWLYAIIGITWAFHFTFTLWMIPKSQSDLRDQGTFFSLVIIYLMNLLVLSVLLIVASPLISFLDFGLEFGENASRAVAWIGGLFAAFLRGAG